MKILIVEDDASLRPGLVDLLRGAGHDVEAVADGASAARRGVESAFDLVLLDLMLPKLDGLEVCRRLKCARPAQLVLMLTARGAEDDTVKGLQTGADDYVAKPFSPRELLARIEAMGRRLAVSTHDAEVIEADGCTLDLGRCEARRDGVAVVLTAREAGILRLLHRHRARGVSRAELLEHVWGAKGDLETRTVDMAVANLRTKIERDPVSPRIVVTVKGIGYAWGVQ